MSHICGLQQQSALQCILCVKHMWQVDLTCAKSTACETSGFNIR